MSIKTIKYNDFSSYSFIGREKREDFLNDLKEFVENGGDPLIQVKHGNKFFSDTFNFLKTFLINDNIDTEETANFVRNVFELTYGMDGKEVFSYIINNNLITYKHQFSNRDLGILSFIYKKEFEDSLVNITKDTVHLLKNLNFKSKEEFLLGKREQFENMPQFIIYGNVYDSEFGYNNINYEKSIKHIKTLPFLTILSSLNKINNYTIDRNSDLFDRLLTPEIVSYLRDFSEYQIDTFKTEVSNIFSYNRIYNEEDLNKALFKNNVFTKSNPYITYQDFVKSRDDGSKDSKNNSYHYEWSGVIEQYSNNIEVLNHAIETKDYNLISNMYDLFELKNFNDFYINKNNATNPFFNISTIEEVDFFIEKGFPLLYKNKDNKEVLLLKSNADLLMPVADKYPHLLPYLNFFVSAKEIAEKIYGELEIQADIESSEDYCREVIRPHFSKLATIFSYIDKQNHQSKPNTFSIEAFKLRKFNKTCVKALLMESKVLGDDYPSKIIANIAHASVDNPKIITGVKTYLTSVKENFNNPKYLNHFYNAGGTKSWFAKLPSPKEVDFNSPIEGTKLVGWWPLTSSTVSSYSLINYFDINAKNSEDLTLIDKALSQVLYRVKSQNFSEKNEYFINQSNKVWSSDKMLNLSLVDTFNHGTPDLLQIFEILYEDNFTSNIPELLKIQEDWKTRSITQSDYKTLSIKYGSDEFYNQMNNQNTSSFFKEDKLHITSLFVKKILLNSNLEILIPSLFNSIESDDEKNIFGYKLITIFNHVLTSSFLKEDETNIMLNLYIQVFSNMNKFDNPIAIDRLIYCVYDKGVPLSPELYSTNNREELKKNISNILYRSGSVSSLEQNIIVDKILDEKTFINVMKGRSYLDKELTITHIKYETNILDITSSFQKLWKIENKGNDHRSIFAESINHELNRRLLAIELGDKLLEQNLLKTNPENKISRKKI